MEKKCLNCGTSIEGRRRDAKYCSDECKAEYRNKKTSDALKVVNQTDQPLSPTIPVQTGQMATPPVLEGLGGYVINQSQSQVSDLTQRLANETAEKNRALIELQNEKLARINEKNDLLRQLDKKDFELEKKDQEIIRAAEDSEKKSGLNGIVDTVSNSPVLLEKLLERFMPQPGGAAPTNQLAGPPEGAEWSEATIALATWFHSVTPDIQTAVWNFIEVLSQQGPNMLPILNQFISQLTQTNHADTGTDA